MTKKDGKHDAGTQDRLYGLQLTLHSLLKSENNADHEQFAKEVKQLLPKQVQFLFEETIRYIRKKGDRVHAETFVMLFLECGAKADEPQNSNHATPLIQMIQEGAMSVAELLLDNGANPNMQDDEGNMPIHYAVQMGDRRMVSVLMIYGSQIQAKNKEGKIPVDYCYDPIMQLLLQSSRGEVRGLVALYDAIDDKDYETVKKLIEKHPYSITTQLCFELSPLDYAKARQKECSKIYALLLEKSIHLQEENVLKDERSLSHKELNQLLTMPIFTDQERIHYEEMRLNEMQHHHWWYGLSSEWQQFYILFAILMGGVMLGGFGYMVQYSASYAIGLLMTAPILLVLIEYGTHYHSYHRIGSNLSSGWWPQHEGEIRAMVEAIEPTPSHSIRKQREFLLELMNPSHSVRYQLADLIQRHDSHIIILSPASVFLLRKILIRLHTIDQAHKLREKSMENGKQHKKPHHQREKSRDCETHM